MNHTDEPQDEGVDVPASEAPRSESTWHRVRRFFWQTLSEQAADRENRIRELSVMIELHSEAPMNYALRGELYLEQKAYHLAKEDFETALRLAAVEIEAEGWAVVAQAAQDRALRGRNLVQRQLR